MKTIAAAFGLSNYQFAFADYARGRDLSGGT